MITETRDGLRDAAAAHRDGGLPAAGAEAAAVREFGKVADLAPLYQAELTAAQGRRTALLIAVLFPALVVGWDLLWSSGVARTGPAPAAVPVLARVQDVASWTITALAALLLVTTLRRRADGRHLALAAGALGLAGAVVCGGTAVAMNVANVDATAGMLAANPFAFVLSGAALVASTVRALRLAIGPR